MRIASCCGIAALLASCAQAPGVPEPPIRKIAEEYRTYGRVSDRLQWAPTLCQPPSPAPPRPSVSRDPETHGKTITAAGKIASCMECHESKQDRLFGVKSCAGAQ